MTQHSLTFSNQLRGTIRLPASKSISNRALIIGAMTMGAMPENMPENLAECDDTRAVIEALGSDCSTVDVGAAGTAMRFLTAFFSSRPLTKTITGSERMKQRPIRLLVDALRLLGAEIKYLGQEGFPPIEVQGRHLTGGEVEMPGNVSSQYISALLLIAPKMERGLRLRLTGEIVSRPYIDMTLSLMREFGTEAGWESANTIFCPHGCYKRRRFVVENDWSAASYWFEMMALTTDPQASISLPGLRPDSLQGDKRAEELFAPLGVAAEFTADSVLRLSKGLTRAMRLDLDLSPCPDLAQTLVCTCIGTETPFHFRGLSTLKIKETDRTAALMAEALKLGFVLREPAEGELLWSGERCTPSLLPIDTYNDHRMAMAFAPLAMRHPGLRINSPEVVTKSYPAYWQHLEETGATICTSSS